MLVSLIVAGCTAAQPIDSQAGYRRALVTTDPKGTPPLAPASPSEAQAIRRFIDFYKVFSSEGVRASVREVYASSGYFRDPFHEVSGIDAIEKYFLASTETIADCRFDMQDVASHDGNYYFRWVMQLRTKRAPDEPIEAIGVTHVRFDEEGRVVFHQDYWDAGSVVYERVPVLGWLVGKVKARVRGEQ